MEKVGFDINVLAIYGSPRREGNTALLLKKAVQGVRDSGGKVNEINIGDLTISPCLEIYGCKKDGRCVIQDDFQEVYDQIDKCDGIMIASPIFFYAVSAQIKILMDRCQSFWVRKHWLDGHENSGRKIKKGLFISVAATNGKKLFDGALLSVRYFFDAIGAELWDSLLYRGLDFEGDVLQHPQYLDEAYEAGIRFFKDLTS